MEGIFRCHPFQLPMSIEIPFTNILLSHYLSFAYMLPSMGHLHTSLRQLIRVTFVSKVSWKQTTYYVMYLVTGTDVLFSLHLILDMIVPWGISGFDTPGTMFSWHHVTQQLSLPPSFIVPEIEKSSTGMGGEYLGVKMSGDRVITIKFDFQGINARLCQ